jgi:DNA-binding CsgD family transcriptional regulator
MDTSINYTPREIDVIRLLLLGNYRKMISAILVIAPGTLDNLIKRLYMKLDCHSIEELLIYLLSHGFAVNAERTVVTYMGIEI